MKPGWRDGYQHAEEHALGIDRKKSPPVLCNASIYLKGLCRQPSEWIHPRWPTLVYCDEHKQKLAKDTPDGWVHFRESSTTEENRWRHDSVTDEPTVRIERKDCTMSEEAKTTTCPTCGADLVPEDRYQYPLPFVAPKRKCLVHGFCWDKEGHHE